MADAAYSFLGDWSQRAHTPTFPNVYGTATFSTFPPRYSASSSGMCPSDTSISSSYSDDSMSDIYIRRVNALSGRSYAQLTVPASPRKVIGFPLIVSIPRLQARLIFGL